MFVSMFMFMFMFMFVFVFVFVFVSVFMLMFVFVFVFVFMFMFMFMRILMLMLSSCSKNSAGYPLCQTPSGDIPRGKTPSTLWRYPPFSPMHLLTLIIACTRIHQMLAPCVGVVTRVINTLKSLADGPCLSFLRAEAPS